MSYKYRSDYGDTLIVTRDDDGHLQLVVTNGDTSTLVCIKPGDVPEVLTAMAAWAQLRALAQEIRGTGSA